MKGTVVKGIVRKLDLSVSQMRRIRKAVEAEMDAGLEGRKSSIAMFPAYCDAAGGHEQGFYLALDLGGTNFRVMMVKLPGNKRKPQVVAEAKYKLTPAQIGGTGEALFGSIANYLRKFMNDHCYTKEYGLGYTFSFPVNLLGINEGVLMKWTKDFSASGVVGRKVVDLQNKALRRKGVKNVRILALANDTVGTLQAQAVVDPNCVMGVILGTGFNIAVRVATSHIHKPIGAYQGASMIINMEAGGFDRALPLTSYDLQVDRESGNRGHQRVEKMISGKYLPQLVRLIVLDLVKHGALFDGVVPTVFAQRDVFKGLHMDVFDAGSVKAVNALSEELFGRVLAPAERRILSGVCRAVARRSARVAAALIVASLDKAERRSATRVTVAVDGSLFEKYPGYKRMLQASIRDLAGVEGKRIHLKLTKDGSGIGAAAIAAVSLASG